MGEGKDTGSSLEVLHRSTGVYALCTYVYIHTSTGHVFIFVRCDEIMIMKHRSCQRYDVLLIEASKGLEMRVFFNKKARPRTVRKKTSFGALSTSRS